MKAIKNYVDVMFQDFPKTKKTMDIKTNILSTMEDKFEDLIRDGKTEQEAVGIVIGQFGSIDELKKEFELEVDENAEYLQSSEVFEYMNFKQKFAQRISFGVILILISVGVATFFGDTPYEDITTYGMLFFIAISVLIFVLIGLENSKYSDIDSAKYSLLDTDKVKINEDYKNFRPLFNKAIAIGVLLCIIGIASPILTEDILNLGENTFAIILFPLISLAFYIFINFGIKLSAYEKLLNPEKIRKEEKYEWLYEITMPLAAMFFLFIGFVFNAWHPGWLVFPVTALITYSIETVLEKTKK